MDQHNWATKLLGYRFDILYKPGSENREADALSPMNEDGEFCSVVSNPTWEESSHVVEEVHLCSIIMDSSVAERITCHAS